jgi:muconolactone delta-isomerase
MVTKVPEGTSSTKVDELRVAEAVRAAELSKSGHLIRLWRPPLRPAKSKYMYFNDRMVKELLLKVIFILQQYFTLNTHK